MTGANRLSAMSHSAPESISSSTSNPYQRLAERHFWAPAVGKLNMFDIQDLWHPKFPISISDKVATFGSCFAQHIGRALNDRGFNWLITERAPGGLSREKAEQFNYGVFTCRTGNIYTVSLLKQWVEWSTGALRPPDEHWQKNDRTYDPFRPRIEPQGFASKAEMTNSRDMAIEAFHRALSEADVFVFTLGLTESWFHKKQSWLRPTLSHEYPMCPGTMAGRFSEAEHEFVNQDYPFIRSSLVDSIQLIRKVNPRMRFLLTVSPVPLTATNSNNHVLVATTESKSILRAVAGSVAREYDFVDYFPSYEIITATPFRGTFFETNQRSVNAAGVAHVMNMFFRCLNAKFPLAKPNGKRKSMVGKRAQRKDVVCEEELLEAFKSENPQS